MSSGSSPSASRSPFQLSHLLDDNTLINTFVRLRATSLWRAYRQWRYSADRAREFRRYRRYRWVESLTVKDDREFQDIAKRVGTFDSLKTLEMTSGLPLPGDSVSGTVTFTVLRTLKLNACVFDQACARHIDRCAFIRLETLQLNVVSFDEKVLRQFLIRVMARLKKLIYKQYNDEPFPGGSLIVLRQLNELVVDVTVNNEAQIQSLTKTLEILKLMSSLKSVRLICYFPNFFVTQKCLKKALIATLADLIVLLSEADVEMRFQKSQFAETFGEVSEWRGLITEQIKLVEICNQDHLGVDAFVLILIKVSSELERDEVKNNRKVAVELSPFASSVPLPYLHDDALFDIFNRLPAASLPSVERVCRQWHRCVARSLQEVVCVFFGSGFSSIPSSPPVCIHFRRCKQVMIDTERLEVKDQPSPNLVVENTLFPRIGMHNIDQIVRLLEEHPGIKAMDLTNVLFDSLDCLIQVVEACPQLECLNFGMVANIFTRPDNDSSLLNDYWQRFAQRLTRRLVHLKIQRGLSSADRLLQLAGNSQLKLFDLAIDSGNINGVMIRLEELADLNRTELRLEIDGPLIGSSVNTFESVKNVLTKLTAEHDVFRAISQQSTKIVDVFGDVEYPQFADNNNDFNLTVKFFVLKMLTLVRCKFDDANEFAKYNFNSIETLQLQVDTSKEEALFHLFYKVKDNLRKLIYKHENNESFPEHSLTVLSQLNELVFDVNIHQEAQCRSLAKMLDVLKQMPLLRSLRVTCLFPYFLVIKKSFKEALVEALARLRCFLANVDFEMRFDKSQYDDEAVDEVFEWSFLMNMNDRIQPVEISEQKLDHKDIWSVPVKWAKKKEDEKMDVDS